MGTAPDMVFSRWRAQGSIPRQIQLKTGERLRIALAVAAPDDDLGPVKYQEIENALEELSQTGQIEFLGIINPANRAAIDGILEQKPHIFHFIGHGRLENGGEIALAGNLGHAEWIRAEDFGELFNRHRPGVVLLQACESGAFSASEAFVGVASRVVQQNIPVVVAMQYEVPNITARQFALEFYRRLSQDDPVDKAVQEGRRHISLKSSDKKRDFATPVIFTRVRDGRLFQREPADTVIIPDLIQNARRLEQNEAYSETITIWKEIRNISPDHPEIDDALSRLSEKIRITKIIKGLSGRLPEIIDICKPLLLYLKDMLKEEINDEKEIFLMIVEKFLSKEIPPETLTKMWEKECDQPKPKQGPNYDILAERLNLGEIVLFFGSEVLRLSEPPLASPMELVEKLAEVAGYQPLNDSIPMISQYYQMTEYGRSTLIRVIKETLKPECGLQTNPLYQLLEDIKNPIIMISSCYDSVLENIFKEQDKKFVVISHQLHLRAERDFGKVFLKYSDKTDSEQSCTAEKISGMNLLKNGYSVIYRIWHWFSSMGFFRKITRIYLEKRQVAGFLACLCNRLILHDFPLN